MEENASLAAVHPSDSRVVLHLPHRPPEQGACCGVGLYAVKGTEGGLMASKGLKGGVRFMQETLKDSILSLA